MHGDEEKGAAWGQINEPEPNCPNHSLAAYLPMKASDTQAAPIQRGIELETRIPETAGVSVGGYHNGLPVRCPGFRTAHLTLIKR